MVGTTSQNTPHHTTFPPHHMWCGDFPTKFYSCGVGGGVGCVEKIRVMWGVVWGACKKYMWCGAWCGEPFLESFEDVHVKWKEFSWFTALFSIEFSCICIHITKNWHISKHLWLHLSKKIAKYPTSHHIPPTSHVVWGVPHKILQMWCRGWCGANGKNLCDVGCGVGCVEKNCVMWGVVWGV